MVLEVNKNDVGNIEILLAQISRKPRKTLASHFGTLKRGFDGLKYQKEARNEWD